MMNPEQSGGGGERVPYLQPWSRRELRRSSDPGRAQQLWDSIIAVRSQKQIPGIIRMARYMNRYYQINKEETQRLLDAAVEDNLIKLENKMGTKGNKSGVEEKAYRLPSIDMLPRERHDWYCFHCHSGGEVILCSGCHRVFHQACLKSERLTSVRQKTKEPNEEEDDLEEENDDESQEWLCVLCRTTQKIPDAYNKKERKDLNHLLALLCLKLKNKLPTPLLKREVPKPLHKLESKDSKDEFENHVPDKDAVWRSTFLLKQQISLDEMERRCRGGHYRVPEEFRGDAQLIVHNCVIYHGVHSNLADMARQMLRDCCSDLKELLQCRDCYRYASENREKYWFCKPCRPFHELVYAKQKGFPYWPAKVMRRDLPQEALEVRFFGGYHQRAIVEKAHVKAISTNIHSLAVKRTSLWNKAVEELRKHQELLDKCENSETFVKEQYGDPFAAAGSDIRGLFGGGLKSSNDQGEQDENDDDEEQEQEDLDKDEKPINDSESTAVQQKTPAAEPPKKMTTTTTPPAVKTGPGRKKGGKVLSKRARKNQDEAADDFVVSSSSSQEVKFVNAAAQTPAKWMKKDKAQAAQKQQQGTSPEELRAIIEKMRADFDQEKKRAVNVATRSLERDLERLKADHATELEEVVESQKHEISENKKKQWCFFCEAEAMYWCCWNTAYCSTKCQEQHWHKEHKRNCRRGR